MAINPFEPPRTTDLDAEPSSEGSSVPAEAVRELVESAPWVRMIVWVTGFSLVTSVLGLIIAAAVRSSPTHNVGGIVAQLIGLVITVFFLTLYLTYHQHLLRLGRGESGALAAVIQGQRRLFKTMGVLVLSVIPLVILAVIIGAALGRAAKGVAP
jgi:hypothetical protein